MNFRVRSRTPPSEPPREQAFSVSFAALVMILLCFFVYLNSQIRPDPIRGANVVEAIRLYYGGEKGVERLKRSSVSPNQILDVARQAGFEALEKDGRYSLVLPGGKLFASGDDALRSEYVPTLKSIADLVAQLKLRATIEGHTDNQAMSSGRFQSNWELSAARAVSVLKIFLASGVARERVSAAGRGEFLPIASNDGEEGRARNRRVTLVIESDQEAR